MGDVQQIQKRADLEIVFSLVSASLFRQVSHTNDELRFRNMDPHKRTRKNDPIDAAKNAPPHHSNEKKYKEQSKDDDKAKEKIDQHRKMKDGKEDEENQGSSEDETEDVHCDQDSDISFMNDTDEEMDSRDWTLRLDRVNEKKHRWSHRTDENYKNPVLDQNSQKNEMENVDDNRIATGRKMVVKAADWNPELSTTYKTYRAVGRPERRWEDEINEFLKPEETEPKTGNDL